MSVSFIYLKGKMFCKNVEGVNVWDWQRGVEPVQAMGMTHVGSQSDSVGGGECTSFLEELDLYWVYASPNM